jgi:hypothetical protein
MSLKAAGAPPDTWIGLVTGFAVAMVACGGILAQRLSRGDLKAALVAHLLLTVAVLGVMRAERPEAREASAYKLVAQILGATGGIVVAHAALRTSPSLALPWLSERPAQFVNDAVAVFAPLTVVWAANRRPPNTRVLVSTLVLVTFYRATSFMWHLDAASFTYTVQDFVTGEFAGSAIGVAAFKLVFPT